MIFIYVVEEVRVIEFNLGVSFVLRRGGIKYFRVA